MMSEEKRKTDKQAHKLGAFKHDPSNDPDKEHGKHKASKDIREDCGIRQHKLGGRKS